MSLINIDEIRQLSAAPPVRNFLRNYNVVRAPGLNLFDSAKLQAGRDAHWDAVADASNADRDIYKQLLRELATTSGLRRGPEFEKAIDTGSQQVKQLAPYLMTMAPNLWDQLHGNRGSAASLASSIAQTHPDRTPLENSAMAQTIFKQMPQDGGLAAKDLGTVYKTMNEQGLLGQRGGIEANEAARRVIHVGSGIRGLVDANKEYPTKTADDKGEHRLRDRFQSFPNILKSYLPPMAAAGLYDAAAFGSGYLSRGRAATLPTALNTVKKIVGDVPGNLVMDPQTKIPKVTFGQGKLLTGQTVPLAYAATFPPSRSHAKPNKFRINRGVLAHEMGHVAIEKRLPGLQLPAAALGKLGPSFGSLGTALAADDRTAKRMAILGSLSATPMLASELAASHIGGRALSTMHGGSLARRTRNYLSPYRGVPSYAAATLLPLATYGSRQLFTKDKTAATNVTQSAVQKAAVSPNVMQLAVQDSLPFACGHTVQTVQKSARIVPVSLQNTLMRLTDPITSLPRQLFQGKPNVEELHSAVTPKGKWQGFRTYTPAEKQLHFQSSEYSGPPAPMLEPPEKPQLLLRLQNPHTATLARAEIDK